MPDTNDQRLTTSD